MKSANTKSKALFFFVVVGMVAYGLVNIFVAFCLMDAVDAAIALNMELFGKTMLYTVGISLVELLVGMLSRFALQSYCKCKLIQAKKNRYDLLLHHGKAGEMDISSFSTDVDLLYSDNYYNRCMLVYDFARLIFSAGSIVFLSWKIALVVLITIFLPLFVPALLQGRLQRATQEYTEGMNGYLDFVQDTLQGIGEIRTYRAFDFFGKIHQERNERAEKLRLKNKMTSYLNTSVSNFVGSLSFVATIAICGFLTVRQEITMGALIAVIQLLNSVVGPIGSISSALGELSSTKELAKKYEEVKEDEKPASEKPIARISISNLSYSYDGQTPVLSNINMTLERGRRYAVLGESGVGKSTLAKLLSGTLTGYEGTIVLTDASGSSFEACEALEHIQYVAQEPYVFKISAKDNIYFGKPEDREAMQRRMEKLGIEEIVKDPEAVLANRDRISGGQKQRLVLARASSHKPDVLILDEPTANLDEMTAKKVADYIMSVDCGILIVITHDASKEFLSRFDEQIRL